jgi:hypothetical protein
VEINEPAGAAKGAVGDLRSGGDLGRSRRRSLCPPAPFLCHWGHTEARHQRMAYTGARKGCGDVKRGRALG